MFGLSEILVIGALVVVFFGARRLPQLGGALGKSIRNFKTSVTGEDEKVIDVTDSSDKKPKDS